MDRIYRILVRETEETQRPETLISSFPHRRALRGDCARAFACYPPSYNPTPGFQN